MQDTSVACLKTLEAIVSAAEDRELAEYISNFKVVKVGYFVTY